MSKLGPSFKVCQTCVYWNGSRKVDSLTKLVENYSSSGKCGNKDGFYNLDMNTGATCQHHKSVI